MSYIEKRKDGRIFFVAEATVNGKRMRKRFSSQREANAAEKDWKLGKGLASEAGPKPAFSTALFGDHIEDAISALWVSRGSVGPWITCIRAYLRRFEQWSENPPLAAVDAAMVERFTASLCASGSASGTTNAALRTIRKYLAWAYSRGLRGPVPTFTFRKSSGERTTVFDRVARDSIVAWFRANATSQAMVPVYDEVADFWFVLFRTGCRREELLSATPSQLRASGLWLPKTKTRKERTVPLLQEVREVLERRLSWNITKNTLQRSLVRCRKAMGVHRTPNDFVLHTARHTAASDLVERGADIRQVQELLGHTSIMTTQRYVKVTPTKLREIMEHLR